MSSKRATALGYGSFACSLSFWVLLGLRYIPGFPNKIDLSSSYWLAIWALAILLAFFAAMSGSRRWALAALVPLATFLFVIVILFAREP